ncbi:MAG: GNAT family N-acetyltransferase [Desulfuromonadales bacterium]
MDVTITNNQSVERFEIKYEKFMALLEYKITDNQMTLVHTEVPKELEGKGLGGKLVKFALEHALLNNLGVVAQCEFAQSYIERHKEYSSLLRS